MEKRYKIGILALQGDYERHYKALESIGVFPIYVKLPEELKDIDGLVIPGGESPTMIRLIDRYGLRDPLVQLYEQKVPFFGTCAGAILLASEVETMPQDYSLGFINMRIERNAYGRQRESFEGDVEIAWKGESYLFTGIFIRAPQIVDVGPEVEVIGKLVSSGEPVLVRQGHVLAATFHPELVDDRFVEQIFLEMVEEYATQR
ncbi:MAG: pyridoxal 5'-phosphate synthase glutaminase subunit PdxT [Candidatus Hydrothermota bacterium]|nr:MAG: pyridoxal 5'-phosphate synthase glutaminase subunit PdxT [Candidatus Hydrothermae bacterium]